MERLALVLVLLLVFSEAPLILYDQHLTFHIGNDKTWTSTALKDYKIHNKREFNKIISGLDTKQQAFVKKPLLNNRWRGLKNRIGDLLGFNS